MLDYQQTQDDLSRRRMPPVPVGLRVAPEQDRFNLLEEQLIIKQPIHLPQDGIGAPSQLQHAGEDIFRGIAVDEHGLGPPCCTVPTAQQRLCPPISRR